MNRKMVMKKRRAAVCFLAFACTGAMLMTGCASGNMSSEQNTNMMTVAAAQEIKEENPASVSGDTVTVSAKASVYAVPDYAELRFGVRTQAVTAEAAQQENSKNVDAVMKVLKESGIPEENIQTSMYDVSAQYDWNTGDGTAVIGYSVYTSLNVKNVEISDAGKLITSCTEAGAEEFNGISYSCTSYDSLYMEALQNAVDEARGKAEALAGAAGRTLGEIRSLSEGYQDMTYANDGTRVMAAAAKGAAEEAMDSVSLMPGEAEITATITATYLLK